MSITTKPPQSEQSQTEQSQTKQSQTEKFQEMLAELFETFLVSSDSSIKNLLTPFKKKAWDRFLEIGLPSRKVETFRYVPLKKLFKENFQLPEKKEILKEEFKDSILPECSHSHFIFVDGIFRKDLSDFSSLPSKISVLSLEEAMKNYGIFLQNRFAQLLEKEKDPFANLNGAFQNQGMFFYIPPNVQISAPIQILHVITKKEQKLLSPRIQIFVGKNASVNCVNTFQNIDEKLSFFSNAVVDIILEKNSRLNWTDSFLIPENAWCFQAIRATLKRDSKLKTFSFSRGSKTIRQDYKVSLTEENTEAILEGIWMLEKQNQSHTNILLEHASANSTSKQFFKGILEDESSSSFEGKIFVHPIAQKTAAYQLNQNLILSDKAVANAKPNLEIFADDVKASHGVTVSKINDEELFYLRSRGLTPSQAKNLLILGFSKELLASISIESLKKKTYQMVENYLQSRASK